MRGLLTFLATDRVLSRRFCSQVPTLLRLLKEEAGESAITMAVTAGTVACGVWLILLLTEVDLRPGLAALSEITGPLRRQIAELIGQS